MRRRKPWQLRAGGARTSSSSVVGVSSTADGGGGDGFLSACRGRSLAALALFLSAVVVAFLAARSLWVLSAISSAALAASS